MKKDKTLAGVLSFLIPGLGQIYNGQVAKGIVLFIAYIAGLVCFIVPGVILWIIGIVDAVQQAKEINKEK